MIAPSSASSRKLLLLGACASRALLIAIVAVWSSASALAAAEPDPAQVKPPAPDKTSKWREIRDYRIPTGPEKGEVSGIMRTGDLPSDREAMFDNYWNQLLSQKSPGVTNARSCTMFARVSRLSFTAKKEPRNSEWCGSLLCR